MRYVFNINDTRHYRFPTHTNDLVIDRADAAASEVFVVVLEPGEAPPPHSHPDTEQVFYVLEGYGVLTTGENGEEEIVVPGNVVRIPPGTLHSIRAEGGPMRYLSIDCFPGGRPEAEPTWDSHVRAMCREHGWDYETITKPR